MYGVLVLMFCSGTPHILVVFIIYFRLIRLIMIRSLDLQDQYKNNRRHLGQVPIGSAIRFDGSVAVSRRFLARF